MSQEINLVNPALRPKRDWLAFRSVAVAAAMALLLVSALYAYARVSASSALQAQVAVQARLAALQLEVQSAQAALAARVNDPVLEKEIVRMTAAVKQRGEVLRLAEDLATQGSGGVAEVMRGFSRQRMEGVWLTGFSVGPGGFDIRGRLLDPAALPTYIRRLNAEPAFRGRSFAALDMQGIVPQVQPQPLSAGDAASAPAPAAQTGAPARYTEFALRATLAAAPVTAGGKE
ncbi:MAG: hypothetical protein WC023_00830 [Rhodocyclaceae bacterium]